MSETSKHHDPCGEHSCPIHEPLDEKQVQRRLWIALQGGGGLLAGILLSKVLDRESGYLIQALACLWMAWPIFADSWAGLRRGKLAFPSLVALAFGACLSQGDLLSAGLVAFFMILADQLEHRSAFGARVAIESLLRRTPDRVRRIEGQHSVDIPLEDVKVGDHLEILPGDIPPVDGSIAEGQSTVDESSMTGESFPVDKTQGDDLHAGTSNLTGRLILKVTRVGDDTTLGRVHQLILKASTSKLPVSTFIESNAQWYTRAVVMLAALAWFLFKGDDGLTRAIAILIMACPCSLVLATPSAMIAALTAAARSGILVKQPRELELFHRIDEIFFDKTGTLTKGELQLTKIELLSPNMTEDDVLTQALSLASSSQHPHSRGIVRASQGKELQSISAKGIEEVHGRGLIGTLDGQRLWLGREEWVCEEANVQDHSSGKNRLVLAKEGNILLAAFHFEDTLREEAEASCRDLRDLGLNRQTLITGDREDVAKNVAGQLGIKNILSRLLPQDKLDALQKSKKEGRLTAVVGDGINDAPVLAAGDVGIAMGALGSPVAIESASVALMGSDLSRLPFLHRLSRRTRFVVAVNVGASVGVLLIGLLLSAMGLVSPVLAAVLHNLSAAFILLHSAQIVKFGESRG